RPSLRGRSRTGCRDRLVGGACLWLARLRLDWLCLPARQGLTRQCLTSLGLARQRSGRAGRNVRVLTGTRDVGRPGSHDAGEARVCGGHGCLDRWVYRPRLTGSDLRLTGSDLRLTGSDLRLTGSDLRQTGSELRLTRSELRLRRVTLVALH